jgi:WD40 repeat protein
MCSPFISFQVWSCETGIVRLAFQVPSPRSFANSCIFSEDSPIILFGGNDKVVYVYDNNTGHLISRFETSGCIIAILSTGGKYVICEYYQFCWNVQQCTLRSDVCSLKFSCTPLCHNFNCVFNV